MVLKTTLSTVIFLLTTLSIYSQVDSTYMYLVGGRFSLSHAVTDEPDINTRATSNSFSGSLYLGRKINNKNLIGFEGSYSKITIVDQPLDFDSSTPEIKPWYEIEDVGLSLFYRYYLFSKNNLRLFLEPSLYYSTSTRKEFENKVLGSKAGGVNMNLGLILRLKKRWNILANIWSGHYEYKKNSMYSFVNTTNKETDFDFDFNFSNIRIGAEWLF